MNSYRLRIDRPRRTLAAATALVTALPLTVVGLALAISPAQAAAPQRQWTTVVNNGQ